MGRRIATGLALGVMAALVFTACGNDPASIRGTSQVPDDPTQATHSGPAVEFHGPIQTVTTGDGGDVLGRVQLGGEIVLTVTDDTTLQGCGPTDGRVPIGFDKVTDSLGVEAYAEVSGPVAESYPMQATADVLAVGTCG